MRVSSLLLNVAFAISALASASAPLAAQRGAPPPPLGTTPPLVTLPAPAGVTVRNDPGALVFSWQPVVGAVGYQIDAAEGVTGPWTTLVKAPIASTFFSHTFYPQTPYYGRTLYYYRIAAVHLLGNVGNSTIVPFIYDLPLGSMGASAVQSGANITLSWIPAAGALSHTAAGLQVSSPKSYATLALAAMGGSPQYAQTHVLGVDAQFAGGFTAKPLAAVALTTFDPNLCWPSAGETPGGSAPILSASAGVFSVTLTWQPVGQILAARVERKPQGGAWGPLACLPPLTANVFDDGDIALAPLNGYEYRVTTIGPGGVTGSTVVAVTTTAVQALQVGAVVVQHMKNTTNTPSYVVSLQWLPTSPTVGDYLISSSYGYRARSSGNLVHGITSPSGIHTFSVAPIYLFNGRLGQATSVTVTVP